MKASSSRLASQQPTEPHHSAILTPNSSPLLLEGMATLPASLSTLQSHLHRLSSRTVAGWMRVAWDITARKMPGHRVIYPWLGRCNQGLVSSSVLSVIFPDKFALSLSDARTSVDYNTLIISSMKQSPVQGYHLSMSRQRSYEIKM